MNSHFGTPRTRGKRLAAGLGKREAVLMAIAAAQLFYIAVGSSTADLITRVAMGGVVAAVLLFVAKFRAPQNGAPIETLLWMHLRYRLAAARGALVDTFQTARPQVVRPVVTPAPAPKRPFRDSLRDRFRRLRDLFRTLQEGLKSRPPSARPARVARADSAGIDAVDISYTVLLVAFACFMGIGVSALYVVRAGLVAPLFRLVQGVLN